MSDDQHPLSQVIAPQHFVRAAVRRLTDAERALAAAASVLAELIEPRPRPAPIHPSTITSAENDLASKQHALEEAAIEARRAAVAAGDARLVELIDRRTPGLK